ncbi:pseudouridine synthase [Lactococcus insecticola]|uniref:Pseudouridine synthase n=1 Tax=Pseudolactococcus insecticola TaxID=2709158 RepID=A0A6A0B8B6_9LACT|nr:pseudouridine synthase [Lactococcus insecticola]GFH40634.1 pseudouridine synthase [Lactococcus insecticola]
MRIDEILVTYGALEKSDVKKYLRADRVTVDGKVVRALNFQLDAAVNQLTLDGKTITFPPHRYLMLNKPVRILSANKDAHLKTVLDLLPDSVDKKGLAIIGRLDFLSEGLLLLTDNGKLARNLTKPEAHVTKVYEVETKESLSADDVTAFKQGLVIDGNVALAPSELVILSEHRARVTIIEGKNRQIRKMFLSTGKLVARLTRQKIGPIELDETLSAGQYRNLTSSEIRSLAPFFN